MMRRFPWVLVLASMTLVGCTSMCGGGKRKDMSPEQVVETYLDTALNMKDVAERDKLILFTTGALKAAIQAASPETIRAAYVDRRYNLENYSVVERRDRTPRETEITFQLKYKDLSASPGMDAKDAATVTTENTVSVVRESGAWFIKDVMGNKTAIDFPVSEESRITARASGSSPAAEPEEETMPEPSDETSPEEENATLEDGSQP